MPVDPTSINTTIATNIFANNAQRITAGVVVSTLLAITAWCAASFAPIASPTFSGSVTLPAGTAAANLGLDAQSRADQAYQAFISRFWVGTRTGGHLAIINGNTLGPAANPPSEYGVAKPLLWQYAAGWTVPYTYWKKTANADAAARLAAIKTWVFANWSASDLGVCNNVGGQSATTLDDSVWVVRGLVALYDASSDTTALTYAKAMLDCMNGSGAGFVDGALMSAGQSHWYDATPVSSITWASTAGGTLTITTSRATAVTLAAGQYFNIAGHANANVNTTFQAATVSGNVITVTGVANPGTLTGGAWEHSGFGKGMDSVSYAMAEIAYYKAACPVEGGSCPTSTAYYNAAKTELDWANATLDRAANANCVQSDHLYWSSVGYGSPPLPLDPGGPLCSRASTIALGSSVVGQAEDMGAAIANAWVYGVSGTASYATQAQAVATSIAAKEIDTCGAFLDARDARIAGFAAYDFAANVVNMSGLPGATQTTLKAAYLATSLASVQRNRAITGTFSGDFCGPWQGVWTGAGFHPDQLEISAQAAIITITAAGL